jgi:hypothetical protein
VCHVLNCPKAHVVTGTIKGIMRARRSRADMSVSLDAQADSDHGYELSFGAQGGGRF